MDQRRNGKISRRGFSKNGANSLSIALVLIFILATCFSLYAGGKTEKAEPIKIGFLLDLSGVWATFGTPRAHAAELAVAEINKTGGILGRQVQAIIINAESDTNKYADMTKTLIQRDKVDVIMGGGASSNREVIRSITHAAKVLYFYDTAYEGGVADSWTFCVGMVPEQGLAPLIPFMIKKYGPKVYDMAPDYVWGQLSSMWLDKLVKEAGGEIVGRESIPLEASDFSTSLSNIQRAKADWIYSSLGGREQFAFYNQRISRGVTIPVADFAITIAMSGQHKLMDPPILAGQHETFNYAEEVPGAANEKFVRAFREMWPKEPYINQEAQNEYSAIYLYKKAVELAGTTEPIKVVKALESGISFDAPEGTIKIDPATHHVTHTIHLIRVTKDHKLEFIDKWENVEPYWLRTLGVDLTKKPDNSQYSPLETK